MGSEWTSARGTGTRDAARRVGRSWLTTLRRTPPGPSECAAWPSAPVQDAPPLTRTGWTKQTRHARDCGALRPQVTCHLCVQQPLRPTEPGELRRAHRDPGRSRLGRRARPRRRTRQALPDRTDRVHRGRPQPDEPEVPRQPHEVLPHPTAPTHPQRERGLDWQGHFPAALHHMQEHLQDLEQHGFRAIND